MSLVSVNFFVFSACEESSSSASSSSVGNPTSVETSTSLHTHSYGDWQIAKPSESETGLAQKVCSGCSENDEGHEIKVVLPKLTDSAYQKSSDNATCVDSGKINYSITLDGNSFSFDIPSTAKGHSYGSWVNEVPATEETSGTMGHFKCSVCNKYFDNNKKLIIAESLTIPQLWSFDDTHHWHGTAQSDKAEHTFDGGVETKPATLDEVGEMTYTCTVCKKTKTEEIPKLSDTQGAVLSENAQILFTQAETLTGTKQLYNGVKVVASTAKVIEFAASSKGKDGIDFTHTLKLIGKINQDSRYIQMSVASACTLKVYALSGSTSAARDLNVYSSLSDVTETGILISNTVASGSTLSVLEYSLPQAGTYYLGSFSGGINIYGLYFTFESEQPSEPSEPSEPSHVFETTWSKDETHHWYKCTDAGCEEVDQKAEHSWDNGVETKPATLDEVGEMTYTCICGKTKTEEIPKLEPETPTISAISEETSIVFNASTDLTKDLVPGAKVVQTAEKAVTVVEKSKTREGISFTHAINLGGKINADSRYIEITVNAPFTLKMYVLSGSSTDDRTLMLFNSLSDVTQTGAIASKPAKAGSSLTVFEFSLENAGTYYIGSQSGVIYVFGLYLSPGLHNYSTEWSNDETYHWHECSDAGCDRVIDKDEHAWDNGVETKPATEDEVGEKTYTCTDCGITRTEEIPKLEPGEPTVSAISEDTAILFSSTTDLNSDLVPGAKVVQTAEKAVTLITSSKGKDGIDFTHAIGLGGKINADSRYIELTVAAPCTVKMYAVSKTTSSETTMMMFNSLQVVTIDGAISTATIASGSGLSVIEFTITEAGTYYFGSQSGGINVYGIYVTMS